MRVKGLTPARTLRRFHRSLSLLTGAAVASGVPALPATREAHTLRSGAQLQLPGPLSQITTSSELGTQCTSVDTAPAFYGDTAIGTLVAVNGALYGDIDSGRWGAGTTTTRSKDRSAVSGTGTTTDPYKVTRLFASVTQGCRLISKPTRTRLVQTLIARTLSFKTLQPQTRKSGLYRAADLLLPQQLRFRIRRTQCGQWCRRL